MNSNNKKLLSLISEAILFLLGILLYWQIISHPQVQSLTDFFTWLVGDNSLILFLLILFYILAFQIHGWAGRSIRWIGLIGFMGAFLKGYWVVKRSNFFQLFGFLPIVDASEYYANAQRLLLGFTAQGTTISRPLTTSFYAGLLWLTHNDLQYTLIIVVGLVALAFYLMGETTHRHFGVLPASFILAFSVMFYRNYLGAVSSESLGLIFACLGWSMLFTTFTRPSLKFFLAGLLLLTLGLVTRAGPFFILPFILLVFLIIYRTKSQWVQYILGSLAAIGAGFGANAIELKVLSDSKSYLFPNYLYSLYGMAAGGKGWGFIKIARPDLMAMQEPIRTRQIYQATLDLMKAEPFTFLANFFKQFWYFVIYSNTSVFSFLYTGTDTFGITLMIVLYALSILTIVLLIRNYKDHKNLLLLGVIGGILISVPFVPPQDESLMRAFAVTVPFMALIPAYSLRWIADKAIVALRKILPIFPARISTPVNEMGFSRVIPMLAGLILILAFLPAFLLFGVEKPKSIPAITCPSDQRAFVWQQSLRNGVEVSDKAGLSDVNHINSKQLTRRMHDIYMSDQIGAYLAIRKGYSVAEHVNYLDGAGAWVLIPTDIDTSQDGLYSGCGEWHPDPNQYLFDYIQISSASRIK
jgi:hypothetical protein